MTESDVNKRMTFYLQLPGETVLRMKCLTSVKKLARQ